jgi:hypothetical protein
MAGESEFELPQEIAALIPDEISSDRVSKQAQQAVKEMENDFDNRADKMVAAAKSIPQAKVAINGIFRHPSEFTQEEWDIIVAGLRAHLPLYAIAMKVNCERHFLAKKIQENKDIAQLVMDAKEGIIDETEFQLYKAARSGSMSAIIYLLDHLGQGRGYGEQVENKQQGEDVQITFGEISQADLEEAKQKIEEANKKVAPTLAGELAAMEVPKPATAQELAKAEDMIKAIEKATERKPIDITPPTASPPPYEAQRTAVEDKYDFLENAFAEGGESPFGGFD